MTGHPKAAVLVGCGHKAEEQLRADVVQEGKSQVIDAIKSARCKPFSLIERPASPSQKPATSEPIAG